MLYLQLFRGLLVPLYSKQIASLGRLAMEEDKVRKLVKVTGETNKENDMLYIGPAKVATENIVYFGGDIQVRFPGRDKIMRPAYFAQRANVYKILF